MTTQNFTELDIENFFEGKVLVEQYDYKAMYISEVTLLEHDLVQLSYNNKEYVLFSLEEAENLMTLGYGFSFPYRTPINLYKNVLDC